MTLIAIYPKNEKELVIGMVHFITEDGENCELDVFVTDPWQNKDIGTALTL